MVRLLQALPSRDQRKRSAALVFGQNGYALDLRLSPRWEGADLYVR